MSFNPVKVSLMAFVVLFKILSTHCNEKRAIKNDSLTLKSDNQLYGCRWGGHLPYFKVVISHFQNESEVVLIYMHTASNLAEQEKFSSLHFRQLGFRQTQTVQLYLTYEGRQCSVVTAIRNLFWDLLSHV